LFLLVDPAILEMPHTTICKARTAMVCKCLQRYTPQRFMTMGAFKLEFLIFASINQIKLVPKVGYTISANYHFFCHRQLRSIAADY